MTRKRKNPLKISLAPWVGMRIVEERLMNAVVCVSGSSPAYVYMFIEALADSAVKYGLPRDAAYEMAAQAVLGSAKMVLEDGEHRGSIKGQSLLSGRNYHCCGICFRRVRIFAVLL